MPMYWQQAEIKIVIMSQNRFLCGSNIYLNAGTMQAKRYLNGLSNIHDICIMYIYEFVFPVHAVKAKHAEIVHFLVFSQTT